MKDDCPNEALAAELFSLVEYDQGKAFISDGMGTMSRSDILLAARLSLKHSRLVVLNLEIFIKKHAAKKEAPNDRAVLGDQDR